ncbi:MAG: toprim domain-containing protein [Puniceicoccales bacterium]|jgi:replicative DNA helicase|nr:toprim domain-containing protein [Puniceicoccales bacterium]
MKTNPEDLWEKERLKSQLEDYLIRHGLNPRRPFTCLNPAHPDRHPSMSYDPKRQRVHCFACGSDYDLFDVIGLCEGLGHMGDCFRRAQELYAAPARKGKKPPAQSPVPEAGKDDRIDLQEAFLHLEETDYWRKRGLSLELAKAHRLGYCAALAVAGKKTWPALIIPTEGGQWVARVVDDALLAEGEPKLRACRGTRHLFNASVERLARVIQEGRPVFIVEGEIDALSLLELGHEAIGLGSVHNDGKLLSRLSELPRDLQKALRCVLSLDNDPAGREASSRIGSKLQGLGVAFKAINVAEAHKDPNEALCADREALGRALRRAEEELLHLEQEALEAYRRTSNREQLRRFAEADAPDMPHVPTGYDALDEALGGGLFEGLYAIGAISSLGKTTFVLQLADQAAQRGTDVLIFSLEMSRQELVAKSLSRLSMIRAASQHSHDPQHLAKTARGILRWRHLNYSDGEKALIQEAMEDYGAFAEHLYTIEGSGELGVPQVREAVEQHLRLTGHHPLVVVDYLQLLAPYGERLSDKQNVDKSVLELKRLSRDFHIPLVVISSLNRANYMSPVVFESFKESGGIEYTADVVCGLQLGCLREALFCQEHREHGPTQRRERLQAAKAANPREIELVCLKNRSDRAGWTLRLEYFPAHNYLRMPERGQGFFRGEA